MNAFSRTTVSAALLVGIHSAHCNVVEEGYCLTSEGAKPVRFEFKKYYDAQSGFSFAYVKYEYSKSPLPLVLKRAQRAPHDPQPDELMETWTEVSEGRVIGEYELVSQGASFSSVAYRSSGALRPYSFVLAASISWTPEAGCKWNG